MGERERVMEKEEGSVHLAREVSIHKFMGDKPISRHWRQITKRFCLPVSFLLDVLSFGVALPGKCSLVLLFVCLRKSGLRLALSSIDCSHTSLVGIT